MSVDMTPVLTLEQQAQVKLVTDRIEAARLKRVADKVVETPAETKARVDQEQLDLKAAKVTKEDQVHIDARDARVKAVKSAIVEAKLKRDIAEKAGTIEAPGHELDREAKEVADLKAASVLNKVEPLGTHPLTNDIIINLLASKLDEVINYLNK